MIDLLLYVDPDLCRACGACVGACVHHLAAPGARHVDHGDPRCERCLHCYATCPAGAIQLSEGYQPLAQEDAWRALTPEMLESALAYRRSTRRFADRPLPRDLIAQVVAAGRFVPSGGNRHGYRFTVLTDPGVKHALLGEFARFYDRIRKLIGNRALVALASPFLRRYERAFLNDPDYGQRMKALLDRFRAGEDPVFYGAPAVVIVHTRELIPTPQQDSILAAFAMVLMAQALCLGTCFVSLAEKGLNSSRRCKVLAGLAPEETVHAVLLLGYPEEVFRRPAPKSRKEISWI
jgi:nitroreductase